MLDKFFKTAILSKQITSLRFYLQAKLSETEVHLCFQASAVNISYLQGIARKII